MGYFKVAQYAAQFLGSYTSEVPDLCNSHISSFLVVYAKSQMIVVYIIYNKHIFSRFY